MENGRRDIKIILLAKAKGGNPSTVPIGRCSSGVEHFLGKEGVMSSNLIIGSEAECKFNHNKVIKNGKRKI
jgi:hypothetical protein